MSLNKETKSNLILALAWVLELIKILHEPYSVGVYCWIGIKSVSTVVAMIIPFSYIVKWESKSVIMNKIVTIRLYSLQNRLIIYCADLHCFTMEKMCTEFDIHLSEEKSNLFYYLFESSLSTLINFYISIISWCFPFIICSH